MTDVPPVIDVLADVALFARECPAWCGPDGLPKNFRLYKAAMMTMPREGALQSLRQARAMRMANVTNENFVEWVEDQQALAGIPLGLKNGEADPTAED